MSRMDIKKPVAKLKGLVDTSRRDLSPGALEQLVCPGSPGLPAAEVQLDAERAGEESSVSNAR